MDSVTENLHTLVKASMERGRLVEANYALDAIAEIERLRAAPDRADVGAENERVRHLKRGTEYEVIGEAEAQVAVGDALVFGNADIQSLRDGDMLTVYRCLKTGKLWARLTDEFRDGRFATVRAEVGAGTDLPAPAV